MQVRIVTPNFLSTIGRGAHMWMREGKVMGCDDRREIVDNLALIFMIDRLPTKRKFRKKLSRS